MTSVIIYISVFAVSSYLVSKSEYKSKLTISALLGLAMLILLAAGRYHVGTDMSTYNHMFTRYKYMSWSSVFSKIDSEVLFIAISKFTFTLGGRVLTWGTLAALTALPVYFALKDQYQEISMGVSYFVFCVSFYVTSFNVTRQFIAVAFVFWGLKYVYNDKFLPFLITIVVASGFHTSALISVALWFMWDHKNHCALKGSKRIMLIVGVAAVAYFYQDVISFFSSNFSTFENYSNYAETSLRGKNRDLIVSIFECIVVYVIGNRKMKEDPVFDFMFCMLLVSTLIGFTGFSHPQVKRSAYYFYLPATLVISSYLPKCVEKKYVFITKALICIYFAFLFILTAYILNQSDLIPYHFDLFSPW